MTSIGVTVAWMPDYEQQGDDGIERVHTEYIMPVVAIDIMWEFDTIMGAN